MLDKDLAPMLAWPPLQIAAVKKYFRESANRALVSVL